MELINSLETTMPFFIPICIFIFGIIWGSFLNVCIYRVPQRNSYSMAAIYVPMRKANSFFILTYPSLLGLSSKERQPVVARN